MPEGVDVELSFIGVSLANANANMPSLYVWASSDSLEALYAFFKGNDTHTDVNNMVCSIFVENLIL